MAQMKEQVKATEIELSDKEIANLSDAQFKTLVIRILTEMVEYGHKIEGTVKAMQSIVKENVQGTNSDRKETRTQIIDLDQINIQPEWNEETNQKNSLAGVAQWIEHQPVNQRVAGWIPSQGTCLGCRPGPP